MWDGRQERAAEVSRRRAQKDIVAAPKRSQANRVECILGAGRNFLDALGSSVSEPKAEPLLARKSNETKS